MFSKCFHLVPGGTNGFASLRPCVLASLKEHGAKNAGSWIHLVPGGTIPRPGLMDLGSSGRIPSRRAGIRFSPEGNLKIFLSVFT